MNRRPLELVLGPLRQMRRATIGWGLGLASLVGATVAFWPAFQDASGIIEAIEQLPSGLIDAFGMSEFGTPAGFLRGNLYEFVVPLLLAIAAVATANALTASEEDSGRLEVYLAQPVARGWVFTGRVLAGLVWLSVMTNLVIAVQLVSNVMVGLEIDGALVVSTVVLCGLLALLHGALALAIAGWWPRPSVVLGAGIALTVGGYLVSALFPLSETLKPLSSLSPWKWAFGGDPLVNTAEPWRYLALLVPAVILAIIGVIGFLRRDVRAA